MRGGRRTGESGSAGDTAQPRRVHEASSRSPARSPHAAHRGRVWQAHACGQLHQLLQIHCFRDALERLLHVSIAVDQPAWREEKMVEQEL